METDLTGADLTGCRIYGISAWGLKLDRAKQQNLVITRDDEPEITVDNIEVAQFVYLLLHNEKIRDVIDTIGQRRACSCWAVSPKAGWWSWSGCERSSASLRLRADGLQLRQARDQGLHRDGPAAVLACPSS